MQATMVHIKKLPLHEFHQTLGARLGTFGEWEVPLYYSSVIDEHKAVRNRVGIFDISHMGEIYFEGRTARQTLNYLLSAQVDRLVMGKALYSPVCNEKGGIVDDVIVYQLGEESYLVVVNAANIAKDYDWFLSHNLKSAAIQNRSEEIGLLSIQGPNSLDLLKSIFPYPLEQMKYYSVLPGSNPWKNVLIARTGYTGELGYEIFLMKKDLTDAYSVFLEKGKAFGIKPIGFGARDTLRLEACMMLYGQDMNDETTPLEVGLERTVFFDKEFIGRSALIQQKEKGISKKIVGFEMLGHGLARHDYDVTKNGRSIGRVTSGSFSPTLKKNIGLAGVLLEESQMGHEIEIQIRQNQVSAKIVATPFYKKTTTGARP